MSFLLKNIIRNAGRHQFQLHLSVCLLLYLSSVAAFCLIKRKTITVHMNLFPTHTNFLSICKGIFFQLAPSQAFSLPILPSITYTQLFSLPPYLPQRWYKQRKALLRGQAALWAVRRLQSWVRTRRARAAFLAQRRAAITIQRAWRLRMQARNEVGKECVCVFV